MYYLFYLKGKISSLLTGTHALKYSSNIFIGTTSIVQEIAIELNACVSLAISRIGKSHISPCFLEMLAMPLHYRTNTTLIKLTYPLKLNVLLITVFKYTFPRLVNNILIFPTANVTLT